MPASHYKIADLDNQYEDDRVLRQYLNRVLPQRVKTDVDPALQDLGALAGGDLYDLQLNDRENEPSLTRFGPQGDRIDEVELTDLWTRGLAEAAQYGVVATAHEQKHGRYSRIDQFARAYLLLPGTDMLGFLLATTDGAARTLITQGPDDLTEEVLPHLLSRDPDTFWTSGQWRTEKEGGTDLSQIQTSARKDADGTWRLHGQKWFTSSTAANMSLVLARTDETSDDDLTLFYVPIRESADIPPRDGIHVNRVKDKMGARKLPVSEVELDGAVARPVSAIGDGTRTLGPMVRIARTWNSVLAVGLMRRGLALARDFGQNREAFGTPIMEKPLHYDTMASLQATFEGAFHLTFRLVELMGKQEMGTLTEREEHLYYALTPLVKLTTAKQATSVLGEVMEAFGGGGYVEDTGIPMLLRNAYALPLWEGTTNVMALTTLQKLRRDGRFEALQGELQRCREAVNTPALDHAVQTAQDAFENAMSWLADALDESQDAVEAGARRFALTIGHALELALLARHAQWAVAQEGSRATAVVEHFATQGIDHIAPRQHYEAYLLANDVTNQSLFGTSTPATGVSSNGDTDAFSPDPADNPDPADAA
jgi:alkylation response protein AidB-like acyl-CoA dehydrogenase